MEPAVHVHSGFICAINGGRDGYQVPLALHEAGMLDRFVTDYYAPDAAPFWLPSRLARRRVEGLPKAMTMASRSSFVVQHGATLLRLPMNRVYPVSDRLLARTVQLRAIRTGSHVYGYAGYLPARSALSHKTRMIDFEFHPHPAMAIDLLREDADRYPEVAWSFAQEQAQLRVHHASTSWRDADAVVCASAITARSLEQAGCDPARIAQIPYGFSAPVSVAPRRPEGRTRFLFVGQGVQRKGLHHLLRAWREIDPATASLTLVCYVCDPGIAALADQAGVKLLGRQDRAQLDALLAASDVFVMPSILEGFGLVYLEALAAGNHVIGTANTGLPGLPLSPAACSLVPVGDIGALAQALLDLIGRHAAGQLDPVAIAAEAHSRTQADFRREIAEHARLVLA